MTLESPTNRRSHSSATSTLPLIPRGEKTRISASTSNLCLRMSTLASNPSAMQSPPDCFRSQPMSTRITGKAPSSPTCTASRSGHPIRRLRTSTSLTSRRELGRSSPLPAAFPKHCRRPGRRRQLSGFRRIRGSCGPGPRSLRSSTGQRTSARPPPSSGCRSNARDTMPLPKGASAVTSWFSLRCVR